MRNYRIIDIETDSRGAIDVRKDTRAILSIQIGKPDEECEFYYKDGKKQVNLEAAARRIDEILETDTIFIGYNVNGFDVEQLKKLNGIEIPSERVRDLVDSKAVQKYKQLKNTPMARFEYVAKHYGIPCEHKDLMNLRSEKIAKKIQEKTPSVRDYEAKKMAYGTAVYDAYLEFIEKEDRNCDFYKYAVGDIQSEGMFFEKLVKNVDKWLE